MKTTIKSLLALAMLSGLGHAAISITGVVGTSFKGFDQSTNIPVGSFWMVVADTGVSGFLRNGISNTPFNAGTSGLGIASDPGLAAGSASITDGQTFGGDTIIGTGSVTTAGVIGGLLTSEAIAGFESARFALVWFQKSAATLGVEGLGGQKYGILSLTDWVFPASDAGSFSMSATDASGAGSYYSTSTNISAAQMGANAFFTGSGTAGDANPDLKSATFTIVPEPSTAVLGLLAGLGLVARRRRD